MANTPRFTDSTTVTAKAPKDPWDNWANEAAARGAGMDMSQPGQMGNAWTDQFNASVQGRGFGENYTDPVGQTVYQGPINAQGQKVGEPFDPDYKDPQEDYDPDYQDPGPPPEYSGPLPVGKQLPNWAPLQKAINPSNKRGVDPKTGRTSLVPWEAPRGAYRDDRDRIRYDTKPSNWRRAGRAALGFLTGPDLGNSVYNVTGRKASMLNPFTGLAYSAAGAYQGARSGSPVTKTWNPNDEALNRALNEEENPNESGGGGEYRDPSQGTPNRATVNSTRTAPATNAFSATGSGIPSSMIGGRQDGGGNYQPQGGGEYNGEEPPSGGQNTGPQPTTPTSPTNPNTPPAPPSATGSAPPATAAPNPEGRVDPNTGLPNPNGILPQHMPGYQPPGQTVAGQPAGPALNTQEGTAAIQALYRKYYGRDATIGEVQAHWGNAGGIKAVEALLRADTKNHIPGALDPAPTPGTGTGTGTQGSQKPGPNVAQTGSGGGGGGYSYAGFDFGQDAGNRDISKSAKYAFSYFAGQAGAKGVPQPRNKQEAQAWFEQHIAPGMNANGFKVHKVVGDKAFISTREVPGGQWVDFQGNSGGQGDQPLTWQAENFGAGQDADAEALFAVTNTGGGGEFGMDRGGDNDVGRVLDSGNNALDSFAQRLIKQLLEGAALDDVLERERRTYNGLTPGGLAAVGF